MPYENFHMESFDRQGVTPIPDSEQYVFKAFYDSDNELLSFENMVPDNSEDARKIIDNAEKIVSAAKKKAADIEQEAYEKGFAQGEKDGAEMNIKKFDKNLENIQHILEEIITHKDEFQKNHEQAILDLVFRVASRVVHGRAAMDDAIVRENILHAFELAADKSEVTVKVSPENLEYINGLRPEFFERIKDLKSITIKEDPTITPGGCVLETAFGHVDGQLENQLEKITDSVKRAYAQQHGDA
jgi:flagellar assembly protein FliH